VDILARARQFPPLGKDKALMQDTENYFPQYLASPLQILWFETDEVATLLICFIISSLFGGWSWLLLFLGPYFYLRLKKNYPKSFIKHSLYFLGLKTPKHYPSTFEKSFCE
jgi:type IV conjugative transfer system protein TraL